MAELKISRVSLFECIRERTISRIDHLQTISISRSSQRLDSLLLCLGRNLKRKFGGMETNFLPKRGGFAVKPALEIFQDQQQGAKPTSYVQSLTNNSKKQNYAEILTCTDDDSFKYLCSELGNTLANQLKATKGILIFSQFTIPINKILHRFLGILITDYENDILHYDENALLKYLEKALRQDFHTTFIYPYLYFSQDPLKTPDSKIGYEQDFDKAKLHVLTEKANIVCDAIGLERPKSPIEEVKKLLNSTSSIVELKDKDKQGFNQIMKVDLDIYPNFSLKFPLGYLEDKIKIFKTEKGAVLFFEDSNPELWFDDMNLLDSGKFRFESITELRKLFKGNLEEDDKTK
ncbi:MAG: hypothetical protein KKA65_04940 [Nanoarchaeota archaeon]|nr:hypothetical protein [Nanoarchaeota archaeon]MCG2719579.1 hypothetical protein [Nanoarchaeota archaeon]